MFDLLRAKEIIADQYFRTLRYIESDMLAAFINRWLNLLEMYSQEEDFVSFDPKIPVLNRLVSKAVGVLIVPFPNTKVFGSMKDVSVFPMYPFRICKKHETVCSRDGLDVLIMYLEMTGIERIGFLKMRHTDKIISTLQEKMSNLKIYGPSSFGAFKLVCAKKAKLST